MRSRGGATPITTRLASGTKPSRCGTSVSRAAGAPGPNHQVQLRHRALAGPGGFAGHAPHLAGQAEPEVSGGSAECRHPRRGLVSCRQCAARLVTRPDATLPPVDNSQCYPQDASPSSTKQAGSQCHTPAPGAAGRIGDADVTPAHALIRDVRAICSGRAVVAGPGDLRAARATCAGPDDLRGGSGRCGRSGQLGWPKCDMKAGPSARSGLPSNPPRVLDSRMRREN